MPISASVDEAKDREAVAYVDGQPYVGREYIGAAPKPGTAAYGTDVAGEGGPQAYLVMQPPGSVTRPHFHQTNQFQVFVGGSGKVGKLRTDPVTVQYAGADTPYGPIVAEDDGIHYFTLRQHWDSGAKYLPAQSDQLRKGQQRQVVGVTGETRPAGEAIDAAIGSEDLFPAEADGLLARVLRLPPNTVAELPDAGDGGGQYHVVLSGTLVRDGETLDPMSLEFAFPDEGTVTVQAGPEGLALLLARFPRAP